jgi:hypothetical protein
MFSSQFWSNMGLGLSGVVATALVSLAMFSLGMAQPHTAYDAFTEPTGCASKLIREQGKFRLYLPLHDTPIQQFDTLADYIEYWKTLHRRGNTCPILYYESTAKGYREVSFDAALARALDYTERANAPRSDQCVRLPWKGAI